MQSAKSSEARGYRRLLPWLALGIAMLLVVCLHVATTTFGQSPGADAGLAEYPYHTARILPGGWLPVLVIVTVLLVWVAGVIVAIVRKS